MSRQFRGECNGCKNVLVSRCCSKVFTTKPYPSLGLCIPQAILEENPVLHIHDCNNQHHILLQRYACKRASHEHEASSSHSCGILALYSENTLETISEGLKSKSFLVGHAPRHPLWARYIHIYALCVLLETPLQISAYTRGTPLQNS